MKKRYDLPEEEDNFEKNMVNEPAAPAYGMQAEMTYSPPLTEEELKNTITTEELLDDITQYIHELFAKK
ncbi:MAG: hypothetical protein LUE93_12455 [Bacteroides sp.]|nr:hypothetical protein [Bacteroides sp.]